MIRGARSGLPERVRRFARESPRAGGGGREKRLLTYKKVEEAPAIAPPSDQGARQEKKSRPPSLILRKGERKRQRTGILQTLNTLDKKKQNSENMRCLKGTAREREEGKE